MNLKNLLVRLSFCVISTSCIVHAADNTWNEARIEVQIKEVTQSVIRMGVRDGLTMEQSVDAMIAKANELDMELIGRQSLHKSAALRGNSIPRMEVLQLCNTQDAVALTVRNPVYAAYLPCRISLIEDGAGRYWLATVNLDILVNNESLTPELQEIAIRINQGLLAVMTAGAIGQ